jgi:hypothetical protein
MRETQSLRHKNAGFLFGFCQMGPAPPPATPRREGGRQSDSLASLGLGPVSRKWDPFSAEQFIIGRFVGGHTKKERSYVK